jgi:hypothetical protein
MFYGIIKLPRVNFWLGKASDNSKSFTICSDKSWDNSQNLTFCSGRSCDNFHGFTYCLGEVWRNLHASTFWMGDPWRNLHASIFRLGNPISNDIQVNFQPAGFVCLQKNLILPTFPNLSSPIAPHETKTLFTLLIRLRAGLWDLPWLLRFSGMEIRFLKNSIKC